MLAREADLVLGRRQLLLEGEDVLVGLELGIVLDDGEQGAQGSGQHVLGLGLFGRSLGARRNGVGPRFGDLGQDILLEVHVALDRVDEVRDEIVPALQLDLDLGEGLIDPEPLLDQPVVEGDQEQDDRHDDDDEDDQRQ